MSSSPRRDGRHRHSLRNPLRLLTRHRSKEDVVPVAGQRTRPGHDENHPASQSISKVQDHNRASDVHNAPDMNGANDRESPITSRKRHDSDALRSPIHDEFYFDDGVIDDVIDHEGSFDEAVFDDEGSYLGISIRDRPKSSVRADAPTNTVQQANPKPPVPCEVDALTKAVQQAALNGAFDQPSHRLEDDVENSMNGSFPTDLEFNDDDDPMIAAANAEALQNDEEGFYGQEFGVYAARSENGDYFDWQSQPARGATADLHEPNLTPITERSEMSHRNSAIFSSESMLSPRTPDLGGDDVNFQMAMLRKFRRGAWGGSQTSLPISLGSQRHLRHHSDMSALSLEESNNEDGQPRTSAGLSPLARISSPARNDESATMSVQKSG